MYMTDFFLFARLNLPNALTSIAKKIDSEFPFPCFDVPKELDCVAAVSFPFPNAGEREENCERVAK